MGSGVSTRMVGDVKNLAFERIGKAIKEQNVDGIKEAISYFGGNKDLLRSHINSEDAFCSGLYFQDLYLNDEYDVVPYSTDRGGNGLLTPLPMDALQQAILDGSGDKSVEICRLLLREGANPNHRNQHGWAALHFACAFGDVEKVKLLLEQPGIDLDLKTTSHVKLVFPEKLSALIKRGSTFEDVISSVEMGVFSSVEEDIGMQEEQRKSLNNLGRIRTLLEEVRPKNSNIELLATSQIGFTMREEEKSR